MKRGHPMCRRRQALVGGSARSYLVQDRFGQQYPVHQSGGRDEGAGGYGLTPWVSLARRHKGVDCCASDLRGTGGTPTRIERPELGLTRLNGHVEYVVGSG